MTLVEGFIDLAERSYAIDWTAMQRAVAARLRLTSSFDGAVYDPRRHPTYWCVPLLVGSYVGASSRAVLEDTEAFVSGCVIRHCMFEPDPPFDAAGDEDAFRAVADAYQGCRLDRDSDLSFDARFSTKCQPWTVLLALGTRSIAAELTERADYDSAMNAIVLVHSCQQMIDDWHDRAEDAARSHWNMWVDAPAQDTLAVMQPLLSGSRTSLASLRPHLLRSALGVQLQDTASELGDVLHCRARAR